MAIVPTAGNGSFRDDDDDRDRGARDAFRSLQRDPPPRPVEVDRREVRDAPAPARLDPNASARSAFARIREREIDARMALPEDVKADPDVAAKARRAARWSGVSPMAIERNMPAFELEQRVGAVDQAMKDSPRLRGWFARQGNARVSHDDVDALKSVASTYDTAEQGGWLSWMGDQLSYLITTRTAPDASLFQAGEGERDAFVADAAQDEGFFDRIGSLLVRGNTAIEEGLLNALAQTTGSPRARKAAEIWGGVTTAPVAGATGWNDVKENPFRVGSFVIDATAESLPYMAVAAVPYVGVATVATSQSGNIAAERAVNDGGARGDANIWDFVTAAPYGLTSAVLDRIGIEAIFAGSARSAARRIGAAGAAEGATEFLQGNVEYAGGTVGTRAGYDWRQGLEEGFAGVIAGAPAGAGIRGGVEVAQVAAGRFVQYTQARASERLVDQVFAGASNSKLRMRDPELFAEFLAEQARGTPAENLYVDGDVLRSLFQDEQGNEIQPEGGIDWEQMLPDFWDQLSQANASGGDVVIPMARAAAFLAGTPEWEVIKGASRVAPGGLSPNEAKGLENDWADVIEQLGQRAYAEARSEVEAEGPRTRVYNEVLSQARQAGFSLNASRAYADLWAERYAARAAYLGGGTDAWALFEESVAGIRQDMGSPAQTYRRGDGMDVVINAMRSSAEDMQGQGEGLIDRLIRGGGVIDAGGDIRSMGGDRVRKGGYFGRPLQPLIRDPDENGQYDEDLSLDTWALNLWEEGYFGPREERPDVNELLDLIGDALRGDLVLPFGSNDAAVEANNAIVAAADDLRNILEEAGLDPLTATREEIDAALAAQDAPDGAVRGFEQFAGPQSETADLHALQTARDMLGAGRNAEFVRRETGWFRGPDGRWRYEISDEDARLAEDLLPPLGGLEPSWEPQAAEQKKVGEAVLLGDLLQHDRLYAAYPDLKVVEVSFESSGDAAGSVDAAGMRVTINPARSPDADYVMSTLLHEVQHLIQRREGFARGGSPRMSDQVKEALEKLAGLRQSDAARAAIFNRGAIDAAENARELLGAISMFETYELLIRMANSDRPSGQLRHIRGASGWIHSDRIRRHPDPEIQQRAIDLNRAFYLMPKRGRLRELNIWLRDYSFTLAQLLRDAMPEGTFERFRDDPRQTKSISRALEREARKLTDALAPIREAERIADGALRINNVYRYKSNFEIYQGLAGEAEARNTQARAALTEAERRDTPPDRTADVPAEETIVVFQDGEITSPFIANLERDDASRSLFQSPLGANDNGDGAAVINSFIDLLSAPGPTSALYSAGDVLLLDGEVVDVISANAENLSLRMREGGVTEIVPRADPRLEVAPFRMWGGSPRSLFQSAWHGSPRTFDRFSTDFMGSGEGVQAFGWGLYFTNAREIGEHYRKVLSGKDSDNYTVRDTGDPFNPSDLKHVNARAIARRYADNLPSVLRQLNILLADANETTRPMLEEDIATIGEIEERGGLLPPGEGRLYEVDIPEDDEFLSWEVPLSGQPEIWDKVIDATMAISDDAGGEELRALFEQGDLTGEEVYKFLAETYVRGFVPDGVPRGPMRPEGAREASEILLAAGVAGNKYQAGQMGGNTPEGAFNYVVFDAGRVEIRSMFQSRQGDLFSQDPAFDPPASAATEAPAAPAATDQPLARDDAPGRYATRTEIVQENTREIGAERVTTVEEAAQAMAYLGRGAVERFDALVTDADGKPLAIVGAFKGAIGEAPVYPATVMGEAFRINGAARIWFAHNHPSGNSTLSRADRMMTGQLREAFRGSGIEAMGIFAIGGDQDGGRRWTYSEDAALASNDAIEGVTSPPAGGTTVPVVERVFTARETLGPPISSWSIAQEEIPRLVGFGNAIVLLSTSNEPLAVVPYDPAEVGTLRRDGRMDAFYRAISMSNAGAALVVHDGSLQPAAGSNLAGLLNSSGVVVHDIVKLQNGNLTSWRASSRGDVGQKTFKQEGARGRIDFLANGRAMITLFEGRDMSTLLHEGAHLWLEELRQDARTATNPVPIRDWETIKRWMKKETGKDVIDGEPIPTEAHELFARGMERYFMEGKAPSEALRKAFSSFRAWLVRIYKRVAGLNVNLDDEVRQVFDRMLATEDAIRFAQSESGDRALFNEASAAGMTEAEFKAYQDLVTESRTEAYDNLLRKTMDRVRIERTKEAKEKRAKIRLEVEAEISARAEWRAVAMIRGTGETYMPLSKAGVIERVGRDAIELLPAGRPGFPTIKGDGLDPDLVAERAGFPTGRLMLEALIGIGVRRKQLLEAGDRRTVLEEAIDVETDRRMTAEYGDILSDGTIEEEALEIIHTNAGSARLAAEVRQLAKQAGEAPTPEDAIRSWAERIVGEARVVDQASGSAVERHRRAAVKAGKAAEQAYLNGDFAEAFKQKQRQQIANALFIASRTARDRVEVIGRKLDRYSRSRGYKGMSPEYLDRIHELLEQYDLRKRSEESLRERERFDAWAARQREQGIEVSIPDRLLLTGDKHFTRLTFDEILALDDAVESLANLGRQKMRLKIEKEERDLEEIVGQAVQNAAGLPLRPFSAERNPSRNLPRELNAALVKIEFMADYLDDNDPNGVFNEVLVKGATAAANRLEELQRDVIDPLAKLYLQMPAKERRRFAERISVPEFVSVNPETFERTATVFMRSELIAVALNIGNKSNFDKMIQGETKALEALLGERGAAPHVWTEAKVMAVLNRHLNESDWAFVEQVWERVNSLWPAIVEAERELTGMTPEKVEGRPVETPYGTIQGGYYPIVYDPNRSQMAANNADQEAADIFGAIGRFVGTPKGHTISRTSAAMPITFSLERVLFSHVKKVSTRIAYGRYVRDTMKFVGHPKIRKLFEDHLGMEYHGQIKPWLKEQIQDASVDLKHLAALDKILRQFRINMTIVGLGFRFTTMFAQIAGWHNSQAEIGTKWLLRGVKEMARNGGSIRSFVFEKSPELASRAQAFDRDVRLFYQQAAEQGRREGNGLLDKAARAADAAGVPKIQAAAFWGIGMIDVYMVAMPTWLGAYHKALEEGGMSDAEAVAAADKAVRKSQSSGRAKDLAAVQRGPEGIRVLTTFYSYFNVLYNKQAETVNLVKRGNEAGRRGDKAMKYAHWRQASMNLFWIMLIAPVTSALLTGDLPEEEERDLEGWTAWAMTRIFFGLWAGVPGIRDIASGIQREIEGKFVGDVQSPFFTAFDAAERPIKDLFAVLQGDEPSERWIKNAIVAPGYFLGLPTGQLGTTVQYLADVAEGDQNPEGAGDVAKGVIKGPQADQE